ncbi:hypothetical protein Tco_0907284 [Tanacetum coccineum]|uniref:Uncharacterized protein n=1 Tax=Tanacetum coccineum TaxID=301880 RepID=A0ABQ5CQB4_9ASTR
MSSSSSFSSHATVTYTSAPLPPIPTLEYLEYLAPSDDDIPAEDQPLSADASPIALLLGYVADSEHAEDDFEEDPEMDPLNDDKEELSKEEEEPLAPTDSALPISDYVPSSKETGPFETDETTATPPPLVPPHTVYGSAPTSPLPPPSLLTPLSSLLSRITSPPFLLLSARRDPIPEAGMPLQKRVCFTTLYCRFKIRESSIAVAARQLRPAVARGASVRVLTALEEVNERMTDLAATHRQDSEEFYMRHHDA